MLNIYTTVCGRTEFIELQHAAFQKYLQEPFHMTVFNNCMWDRPYEYAGIAKTCQLLGIECIDIQKDLALIAHCETIEKIPIFNSHGNYSIINLAAQYSDNWAWQNVISKSVDPILLLHADVFLRREIRLSSWLNKYRLGYVPQARDGAGEYMHDALVLADIPNLPDVMTINWCGGQVNGVAVDGGGQTHHYLAAHPELEILKFGCFYHQDEPETAFHPSDYEIFQVGDNPAFLHYRTGYNWNRRSDGYHQQKTEWLRERLAL